ncbi:MAG: hypothetical protein V3R73_04105 [Sphingomonadales bacterium]
MKITAIGVSLGLGLLVLASPASAQQFVSPQIKAAVDNPARSEADRKRDAGRKPGEVLSFIGIMPGMTVLDVFSGGGYYSEILSYILGPDGQVIAHYNDAYQTFVGKEFEARYAGGRLANVRAYKAEANAISLTPESVDLAIFILGFHDIYYRPKDVVWPDIDTQLFMKNIYVALRPSATFVVLDHVAQAGSPLETGDTLHRIDPALVISMVTEVGFKYVGSSDVLKNPVDDHSLSVFDPAIRGRSDRFLLKFRKPESKE